MVFILTTFKNSQCHCSNFRRKLETIQYFIFSLYLEVTFKVKNWKSASNQNGALPSFYEPWQWDRISVERQSHKLSDLRGWPQNLHFWFSHCNHHKNQKVSPQYIAVMGALLLSNSRSSFCKPREATVISKMLFFGSLIKTTALKDGAPYGTAKGFPSSE